MYRITKPLNHNALLAFNMDDAREYLVVGRGVGFGRKPGERVEDFGGAVEPQRYLLSQAAGGRGDAHDLLARIDPVVLDVAELADRMGVELGDDEVGLIALHVHSSLDDGHVEQAIQVAQLTRACIGAVERLTGSAIDVSSYDYNRLMTHVKYMVTRIIRGERLSIDVNETIKLSAPSSYRAAEAVCAEMERLMGTPVSELEVGYLAMHIARVAGEESRAASRR